MSPLHLQEITTVLRHGWVMKCRSWLRHCATSRKGAGSISDSIIGIFHMLNPSDCIMVLRSTQTLKEMSARSIPLGVKAADA
jgi:hypothetical protein